MYVKSPDKYHVNVSDVFKDTECNRGPESYFGCLSTDHLAS